MVDINDMWDDEEDMARYSRPIPVVFGQVRQQAQTKAARMAELEAENARLTAELEAVEKLRPHWAQGWTSDGVAAQVSTAALSQLWELLGTTNQTQAVRAVVELKQAVDAETRKCSETIRPSLGPQGNGVVVAELHRQADTILARLDQRKEHTP